VSELAPYPPIIHSGWSQPSRPALEGDRSAPALQKSAHATSGRSERRVAKVQEGSRSARPRRHLVSAEERLVADSASSQRVFATIAVVKFDARDQKQSDAFTQQARALSTGCEADAAYVGSRRLLVRFSSPGAATTFAEQISQVKVAGICIQGVVVHAESVDLRDGEWMRRAAAWADALALPRQRSKVTISRVVRDLIVGSGHRFSPITEQPEEGAAIGGLFQLVDREAGEAIAEQFSTMPTVPENRLSAREREVATLLSRGLTNRAVGEELEISPATVERHVTNILSKLAFRSRAQIAAWAVQQGLVMNGLRRAA
jgi:DNA-binding CsgD family transcriptional regulator